MADNPSYEQQTEMQYDAFIKHSLDREVKKFLRGTNRLMAKQTLFSEMDGEDTAVFEDDRALAAYDFVDSEFQVLQYSVAVRDALLHDALSQIDEQARNIVLMAYWLDMSDLEISDETDIPRRTVNEIKRRTYGKLKKILEDKGYDANTFFPKGV
jgi:RNA polymerase sigma factor (sigma-70 family)